MDESKHNHKEYHTDVLPRLNRLEGQIKGISKMIENGDDCEKVLVQLLACEGALKKVGNIIIKSHLTHCVKESIERGESDVMESFSAIIEKFL